MRKRRRELEVAANESKRRESVSSLARDTKEMEKFPVEKRLDRWMESLMRSGSPVKVQTTGMKAARENVNVGKTVRLALNRIGRRYMVHG